MFLFLEKKVTKKTKILAMPLCAKDISPHYLLLCADRTSLARISMLFYHAHYPSFYFQYYFSPAFNLPLQNQIIHTVQHTIYFVFLSAYFFPSLRKIDGRLFPQLRFVALKEERAPRFSQDYTANIIYIFF